MLRDKWIQSEKAGYDLGDQCMLKWIREHAAEFRRAYNIRHMDVLDDGTKVESVCIYPDQDSIEALTGSIAMPSGWKETDCRFGMPESAREFLIENLGCSVRIMVAMVGYSSDGIYAAGVVEGVPVACVARIAAPEETATAESGVDWVYFNLDTAITGTLDTFPRQFD